jgi:hypothetical protein
MSTNVDEELRLKHVKQEKGDLKIKLEQQNQN